MSTNVQQATQTAATTVRILIVSPIEGIEVTAEALSERLKGQVDLASTRSAALRMLERKSYAVVVLDQMVSDADPGGADLLWKRSGMAIPLQVSFALSSSTRLEREVRAALARRLREQDLAREAACAALDAELKNALTAFLLEAQLALREEGIPPRVEIRLRTIETIAQRVRTSLSPLADASPDRGIEAGNHYR